MCGIWGIYNFQSRTSVDPSRLALMGQGLIHRGPDEAGSFVSGPVGLGIHRLRVIDLVSGRQPIANEDRTIWTVFNGEIYNYRELRQELEEAGHRFTTQSDTEVIVHLYEEERESCWDRLDGIFAIALWDAKRQELWLARDPLGVKPLYYHADTGRLLFGSELKALLSELEGGGEVDGEALSEYLSMNYVPGPHTIIRGVEHVPAGHVVQCTPQGLTSHRYWELRFGNGVQADPEEYQQQLLRLAREAVRKQILSDVPLGALLSGGVDSSTIVALMAEEVSRPLETFSIRFTEDSYDESDFAKQVSQRFGTVHHEILCDARDCLSWLPQIPRYADNLFADPSLVPTYLVCQAARRSVTVVLSGDGADELFAGYPTYQADYLLQWYQRAPRWVRRGVEQMVKALPPSSKKLSFSYRARKFVEGSTFSSERAHAAWRCVFTEEEKAQLVRPDVWGRLRVHDSFEAFDRWFAKTATWTEPLDRYQHVDIYTFFIDDILVKLDRMSMAHSLEARVPWLDRSLVEFACMIPASLRMRGLQTKHLFKQAAAELLPRRIVFRKKSGFLPALPSWFRGPWRELLGDTFSEHRVRRLGWLNPRAVRRLLEEHWSQRADHSFKLWNLLMLCWWQELFRKAGDTVGAGSG